jgi:outer membrane protein TolC
MRSLLLLFISLVSTISCFSSASAESFSLSSAIDESLKSSPAVLKARSAAAEANWKKRESFAGFLPTVSAGVNYLTDKRYMLINTTINNNPVVFPSIIPTTTYSVTATLPIFDGFASTNTFRAGQRIASAAKKELSWVEFSVARQVTLLYYKAVAAQLLKEVAYQNLETLKDHQKEAKALKRAGVTTRYDVLRVDTQVSEAESEIFNSEDNMELSKFKLGEALGKEKEEREIHGPLPVLEPDLIAKLEKLEISRRHDIQSLTERVESLEFQDRANGRFWVPRVGLFGQYQHYNNINDEFSNQDYFRDAYQIGINLTWNIFDGMVSLSRSQQSAEQVQQIRRTLQQTRLKAAQDFELWRRKFLYFCTVYKARNSDIARSNEAMRLAREGRKAGARTSTDVLDAELDLFRARAGLVNAQIGATEALINLELASGQKLYDFK